MTLTTAEPDGILRLEGGCLMYMALKRGWFMLDEYNARHRSFNWPAGHRPPELVATIANGAVGGVPSPSAKLPYTASQTNHWARHSLELLKPLIDAADLKGKQVKQPLPLRLPAPPSLSPAFPPSLPPSPPPPPSPPLPPHSTLHTPH